MAQGEKYPLTDLPPDRGIRQDMESMDQLIRDLTARGYPAFDGTKDSKEDPSIRDIQNPGDSKYSRECVVEYQDQKYRGDLYYGLSRDGKKSYYLATDEGKIILRLPGDARVTEIE